MDEDDELLKDGQKLRVPLLLMDSVQRSIRDHFDQINGVSDMAKDANKAIAATTDAMRKEARSAASLHRPGYRLSSKMMRDSSARNKLQDIYDAYELDLCSRYKMAPADPAAVIDEDFDDSVDMYQAYDQRISDAWKKQ